MTRARSASFTNSCMDFRHASRIAALRGTIAGGLLRFGRQRPLCRIALSLLLQRSGTKHWAVRGPVAAVLMMAAAIGFAASAIAQGPIAVIAEPAREEVISDTIEAIGTLQANELVEITSLLTERVTRIGFEDGARVTEGQMLVEFASGEESARLAEVRAARREADAELRRSQDLADRNAASETELAERRRAAEVAEAQERAIAAQIADRVITAPFDGVVGIRTISVGSTVAPGEVIARLVDDSIMKLDFSVPATFLTSVVPGASIEATTRAFGDEVFRGQIASIDSVVDPVTRTILVRASIPNEDRRLRPGLLMDINLIVNHRRSIVIDEGAVIPENERTFVFVAEAADDGAVVAARREVETGVRSVGDIEIVSGLTAGEQVVTEGAIKLQPGVPIRLDGSLRRTEAAVSEPFNAGSNR